MRVLRSVAAVAALGLVTGLGATGVAAAADLLEAPTGDRAQDVSAWTSTVARSYARVYTDVACTAVEPVLGADGTLALPPASAGRWIFVVTSSPHGQRQYGPAELVGIVPPDAVGVIACHGTSTGTQLRAQAPPASTAAPQGPGAAHPVPSAAVSATPVPHAVDSGLAGGAGGLAVLGLGTMATAALAVRGRTARQPD